MIGLPEIAYILYAYLLGAIPFGYLFTKSYSGKNILEHGSGNIGSTNVGRIAGKKIAALTQVCDILKGFLPVLLIVCYLKMDQAELNKSFIFMVAFASILGHDFSIFLRMKGGKGVNTTLGASVILTPIPVVFAILSYFLLKWRFKMVSLGSIGLAIVLSISELIMHQFSLAFFYLSGCSVLIIYRHIPNIIRIWKGTEYKSNTESQYS